MKQIFEIETATGIASGIIRDQLQKIAGLCYDNSVSVREILPKTPAERCPDTPESGMCVGCSPELCPNKTPAENEGEMEKVLNDWITKHREKAVITCQEDCICWEAEHLLDKIMIMRLAPDWKRRGEAKL